MTLQELNEYFALRVMLEKEKEMVASLRAVVCPGAQILTGMPHTPGIKDKVGDLAVEIADLEKKISCLEAECEREKERIVEFVKGIENDHVRMIMRLRFLYALTWKEVAIAIGGRNTEESVKSACYRYLSSQSCNGVTPRDA